MSTVPIPPLKALPHRTADALVRWHMRKEEILPSLSTFTANRILRSLKAVWHTLSKIDEAGHSGYECPACFFIKKRILDTDAEYLYIEGLFCAC